MKKAVIIVAGGTGSRMGINIPKQFMLLNGKPLLMHTLQRFYEYDQKLLILLVLPENENDKWLSLVKNYSFSIPHTIVKGGMTRFHSVKYGLEKVPWPCILAIHDGVRPICSSSLINRCFEEAEKNSNAVPAIRISESIREVRQGNNNIIDRENLRIIQTPQCFDSEKLKRAYQNNDAENFTDDAGVFEHDGNKIHLIEGERNNIKITIQDDLYIASALEKEFFSK